MSIRVLHVQKVADIGGAENRLGALLPALVRSSVDVRFCTLTAADVSRFVKRLEKVGVPTTTIPAGSDLNPWAAVRVAGPVHHLRPDLVHTQLGHGDAYGQSFTPRRTSSSSLRTTKGCRCP